MHKVLKTVILFSLISNSLFSQSEVLISSGYEKLQKKNYNEALTDFNKVLKDNSGNVQALSGSSLAQNGLGNFPEATKLADMALILDQQSDIANFAKGEVLVSTKDYAGSIPFYNRAINLNQSYFPSYVGKSKAYNQMGDVKEAFTVLDKAIALFPSSSELFFARGLLNNSREKYSKALTDFDKALSLNPNSNTFGIYFNRGIAYSSLEEYETALGNFDKAAELEPSNANVFYSRGLTNYQLSNYDASVKDFLRSNELSPNNSITYYNLGMAYYKLEDVENACIYFHKSCSMNNTNACKMVIMVCSDKQIK